MKRGKPPARRTPLKRGKGLARSGGPHTGPWPTRSKPIKVKRDRPRRRDREQPEHGLPWGDVRLIIYVRAGGRCELCGAALNIVNMEGHHRRSRKVGPDCPGNALALCHDCHHERVHGGQVLARTLGWIISTFTADPCQQIVELPSAGKVILSCDGTYLQAP